MNKQEKLFRNVQYLRTLRIIREKSGARRQPACPYTRTPNCECSEYDAGEHSPPECRAQDDNFEKEE